MDAKAQRRKEDALSNVVIGAAIDVHRELGPGLLEAIYEECLCVELKRKGVQYSRQEPLPVIYKGAPTGLGYRLDLLVEGVLVVELKAVDANAPLHAAQLLTYLKLTGCRLGILINFGLETIREGLQRVANGMPQ